MPQRPGHGRWGARGRRFDFDRPTGGRGGGSDDGVADAAPVDADQSQSAGYLELTRSVILRHIKQVAVSDGIDHIIEDDGKHRDTDNKNVEIGEFDELRKTPPQTMRQEITRKFDYDSVVRGVGQGLHHCRHR